MLRRLVRWLRARHAVAALARKQLLLASLSAALKSGSVALDRDPVTYIFSRE